MPQVVVVRGQARKSPPLYRPPLTLAVLGLHPAGPLRFIRPAYLVALAKYSL